MAVTKDDYRQSPFSLKEWEEIVYRSTGTWEARKREYTRWSAAGLTSAVILLGIFFQQLPTATLGTQPGVSLFLLLVSVYVIVHMGLEVFEGKIGALVGVLVTAEEEPESPWSSLKNLFHVAERSAREVLASPMIRSLGLTFLIAGVGAVTSPAPSSQQLVILGEWRLAFIAVFLAAFLAMRCWGRKLLPQKEKLLQQAPRAYPPERLRQMHRMSPVLEVLPIVYYSVQLFLLGSAISLATPITYQLLMIGLPLLGSGVLAVWVGQVTWPLVKDSSENFKKLRDLHSAIVSGAVGTPDEVFSQVKRLLGGAGSE